MQLLQKIRILLPLISFGAVSHTSGGEFINGGFELPPITTTNSALTYMPTPFDPVCPSTVSGVPIITNDTFIMTGWFKTGTGVVSRVNGKSGQLHFQPVDGTHQMTFNAANTRSGASISQTFDTVVGQTYDVTFYVARIGTDSASISLTARVLSQTNGNLATLKVTPPATTGYGSRSEFSFTATTPTTTLTFTDTSTMTCEVDITLDNVSVTPASQKPIVDVAFYPGLRIQGRVGHLYRIEYSTEIDTNAWSTLTTISLPSNPYLFVDPALPTLPRRFYRLVELP